MKDFQKGEVVIEGKTKVVYELIEDETGSKEKYVVVENKDKITAFDGTRSHDMKGKAAISNATNAKVFDFLNAAGK